MNIATAARMKSLGLSLLVLSLVGCVGSGPAPVSDRAGERRGPAKAEPTGPVTPAITASTNGLHTVQRGDTLYAIAFANNLDYREVASWNQLESADRILVGQVLRLTPPENASLEKKGVEIKPLDRIEQPNARPLTETSVPLTETSVLRTPQAILLPYSEANWAQVSREAAAAVAVVAPPQVKPVLPAAAPAPVISPNGTVDSWLWPADGVLAGRFGEKGGKGIDIVGPRNAPIKAVAAGKVVYSGSGLRGYGQLLIVKHSGEFLSAYAHNETILVKEGDTVAAGQKIAMMGDSGAERVMLHFEIRRYGKPLDPMNYLPERS